MTTSHQPSESFQIPIEAAELYESAFVPGFFAQWAPILCEVAGVKPGSTVLDVACGTGIVARTAADIVGPTGAVVGLDVNEAMLTVAARVRPDVEWRQGDACSLPFTDGSFDAVLCQMALMFFADRPTAIGEMARVADDWSVRRGRRSQRPRCPVDVQARSSSWLPTSPDRRRCPCCPPTSCVATSTS